MAISTRAIARLLTLAVAFFVGAHLAFRVLEHGFGHDWVYGFSPLFHLDTEGSFPNWYASAQLLAAAALLWLNGRRERVGIWHFLAAVFLFLSADEVAGLHERNLPQLRAFLGIGETSILFYAWIVPGTIFVALVAVFTVPLVRSLPAATRRRFLLAALCYVGGALGMEVVASWLVSLPGRLDLSTVDLLTTVEETLELVGGAIFVHALARHLTRDGDTLIVRWSGTH